MTKPWPLLAALALLLSSAPPADADVPGAITVQGVLWEETGGLTDGVHDFTFRFYDSAGAGTALLETTLTNVPVDAGVFSVSIADGGLPALFATHGSVYLGVTVAGDPQELPRVPISPAPYAYHAEHAQACDQSVASGDADRLDGLDSTALQRRIATSCTGGQFMTGASAAGAPVCAAPPTTAADLACTNCIGATEIGDGLGVAEIDETAFQRRVAATCAAGSSIRAIALDGSVTCESDSGLTSEVDGVVGNEVNGATNTTLTRSGSGTSGSPYTLGLNLGRANTWTGQQTLSGGAAFPGSSVWNTAGRVGIGTTTPGNTSRLDVNGVVEVSQDNRPERLRLLTEWDLWSRIETGPSSTSTIAPTSSSWHPIVINHDNGQSTILNYWRGYVSIGGDPNTAYKFTVNGNMIVNGTAAKPGGGSWTDSSDRRLKHDIKPLAGSLERLLGLRGVTFEWNQPEKHGDRRGPQIGMIAQEVEQVFPDWVGVDADGYRTLTFRGFEALTVESLRELAETNRQLRADNAALTDRLSALEARVARLAETASAAPAAPVAPEARPAARTGARPGRGLLGAAGVGVLGLGLVWGWRRRRG